MKFAAPTPDPNVTVALPAPAVVAVPEPPLEMEHSGGALQESANTGATARTGAAASAVPELATNTTPAATATITTFFGTFMIHSPVGRRS